MPVQQTLAVRADRENGVYHRDEIITFSVKAEGLPAGAEIKYDILMDSVESVKSGETSPGAKIEIKAGKECFLGIILTSGKLRAEAAAAIDPGQIKPTLPPPSDFKAFWVKKLADLAAVPMNPRIKKTASPAEAAYQEWNSKWPVFGNTPRPFMAIDVFEVEVDTLEGNPARGYYAYPSGAAPKSLPAVLFTHGAGIGDSDLQKTCAAAQHGFLAMDINAHGLLNGQIPEYYERIAKETKKAHGSFFKKDRLDKNTHYVVKMYLRHRRALDFLYSRPEWNGRDLVVRGASQGGCLALACAGLDPRVSRICTGVPAFCDTSDPYSLKSWFLNENDDNKTIDAVRNVVRYVSVGNFAPDIKAEAYFTVAFLDRSCHPRTVYAAYNAYAGPKRISEGPAADHGGIPQSIHYDDFTKFMTGNTGGK